MLFDEALSGGKRYGTGQRHLSPDSFQKGSENWKRTEEYWNQQQNMIFIKESI